MDRSREDRTGIFRITDATLARVRPPLLLSDGSSAVQQASSFRQSARLDMHLNSLLRDSSVSGSDIASGRIRPISGPDRHYVPPIHAATRAKINIDPY